MIDHRRSADSGGPRSAASVTPHDDPGVWGPRLARLVASQCALCRTIESLGERQSAMIEGDDTDGLLRLLAERQTLLDELASLSEQLGPFRSQWEQFAGRLPAAERQALQRNVKEMTESVERISARDEVDRTALERRRSVIAEALGDVRRGRGAIAAYVTGSGEARYQDREG